MKWPFTKNNKNKPSKPTVRELLEVIHRNTVKIMATQAEHAAQLTALKDQVDAQSTTINKIGTETDGLKTKIAALEEALNNQANVSPEVEAAFAAVKASVDNQAALLAGVDEKVPDAPPNP